MNDTEIKTIETLLTHGTQITIPVNMFFGLKKEIKIRIKPSYAGTLYSIAHLAVKMDIDEEKVQQSWLREGHKLAIEHMQSLCEIIAIAILNGPLKIRLFKKMLGRYLFWKLTPEKLFQIVMVVIMLGNTSDFLHTIRLVFGTRITQKTNQSPEDHGG